MTRFQLVFKHKFKGHTHTHTHIERERERGRTYFINHGISIGETTSRATVKINAIREIVGLSKRWKIVVIAIVNERVSKYEHGRNLCTALA